MRDRPTERPVDPSAYQLSFFPLVPYSHNSLAGLVGGIIGALWVVLAHRGEYVDAVFGGALIAQALLGGFALMRQRRQG